MSSEPAVKEIKGEESQPAQVNPLLLDSEGAISDQLYNVLRQVFDRYSKPPTKPDGDKDGRVCGRDALNAFAKDTNGQEMTDETYNEIVEYLDVTSKGELSFKGFIQLYQLQTENDASETEKDLRAWGYDAETLELDPSKEKKNEKASKAESPK
ncbi:uncharacterized protein JCM15063_002159 [Sporobolomyces koalae]|uniref:uncharacterized protein n=1 Tax=Sporobolomyces koalae TaxID=500713 RepID=UPI003174AD4C